MSESANIVDAANMVTLKPVTVITGASGGIGADLAYQFANLGEDLLLVARSGDKLAMVADKIQKQFSVKVTSLTLDLSQSDAPEKLEAYVKQNSMQVHHLVNNAGFGLNGMMQKLDNDSQLNMIDLNVRALAELSLRFMDDIEASQGGLMNIASTVGFLPAPYMGVYGATKAFVLSFTEALAGEKRNSNIKICAVCPGPTATGFGKRAQMDRSDLFDHVPTMSSEEVAKIAFKGYMRGKTIVVTGISNQLLPYLLRLTPRWVVRLIAGHLMNTEK